MSDSTYYERNRERLKKRQNDRYHAEKTARGEEFLKERAAVKRAWRAKGNDAWRHKNRLLPERLCHGARKRARKAGVPATFHYSEIQWPSHCPVFGIELDYSTPLGGRMSYKPNNPSLDRWNPRGGYEVGNVFVISQRANMLRGLATEGDLDKIKKTATVFEYERLVWYIKNGVPAS